jgi:pimeloyl-ACP methyl ester carboxylesterase
MPDDARQLTLPDGRLLDLFLSGPDDGTPLVFHHGSPSSGIPDAQFVAALAARGLRYVGFSRAGYGSSSRRAGRSVADVTDDVAAILDHIGAEQAYAFGWSGGGPHAIACAALLPDRFRAAALVGGVAPWPAEGLDWFAGMGPENVEEFQAALADPTASVRSAEKLWPAWRAVTATEIADAFGGLIDEVDRGSLTGAFAESVAASTREGLRESYWGWVDDDLAFTRPWGFDLSAVRVPVHVWQGGHDRMVPYGHGEWLASHIASAVPHLLPDEGHLSLVVGQLGTILDALLAG